MWSVLTGVNWFSLYTCWANRRATFCVCAISPEVLHRQASAVRLTNGPESLFAVMIALFSAIHVASLKKPHVAQLSLLIFIWWFSFLKAHWDHVTKRGHQQWEIFVIPQNFPALFFNSSKIKKSVKENTEYSFSWISSYGVEQCPLAEHVNMRMKDWLIWSIHLWCSISSL